MPFLSSNFMNMLRLGAREKRLERSKHFLHEDILHGVWRFFKTKSQMWQSVADLKKKKKKMRKKKCEKKTDFILWLCESLYCNFQMPQMCLSLCRGLSEFRFACYKNTIGRVSTTAILCSRFVAHEECIRKWLFVLNEAQIK